MKKIIVFALLSVFLACLSFYLSPKYKHKSLIGKKVFPDLYAIVDMVDEIILTSRHGEIVIKKNKDGIFILPRLADFMARKDRVKSIILGAALLEYFEKKTLNVDNYGELWVNDPTVDKDSRSVRLVLKAEDKIVFDMLMGKEKTGISGFEHGIFVRHSNEKSVWLARRFFDATGDILSFINTSFPVIVADNVKNVTVIQGKKRIIIGDKTKYPQYFNFFEKLHFYDVVKDDNQKVIATYEFALKGGVTVIVSKIASEKGNPYIKLFARKGKAVADDSLTLYNQIKEYEGRLYKIDAEGLSKLPEIKSEH